MLGWYTLSISPMLLVCFRYIGKDNRPTTHFLGVRELEETTADAITKTLRKLISDKGLDERKLVGLAADGASVMQGCRTGVVTQ